jgi:CSLREA domain-containing protein
VGSAGAVYLFALTALPAMAATADYKVDSTADLEDITHGTGTCAASDGKCTLRAAIETVNADATPGKVTFDASVFNGEEIDTIFLTEPLPAIDFPTAIEAGSACTTAGIVGAPCAGVTAAGLSGAVTKYQFKIKE